MYLFFLPIFKFYNCEIFVMLNKSTNGHAAVSLPEIIYQADIFLLCAKLFPVPQDNDNIIAVCQKSDFLA